MNWHRVRKRIRIISIAKTWRDVRDSLWFFPGIVVGCGILLAVAVTEFDHAFGDDWVDLWPEMFRVSTEGARAVLSAIATSVMTVVGVAFSITVVALSLASSLYTSRILRNFMRDRGNQLVLGAFGGIFAYCLLVLSTIADDEPGGTPALAVAVGVALALLSVAVLVFFIHHVGLSIEASWILQSVYEETRAVFRQMYGGDPPAAEAPGETRAKGVGIAVRAPRTGYIQDIDAKALLKLADEMDATVEVTCAVGDFIVEGQPIARLAGDKVDEAFKIGALRTVQIGGHRTIDRDPLFGFRQINDIALKALSPGINDSTTALMCVQYVTALLSEIAECDLNSPYCSSGGRRRLFLPAPSFEDFVRAGNADIIRHARGNVALLEQIAAGLEGLGRSVSSLDRVGAILEQLDLLAGAASLAEIPEDEAALLKRIGEARSALERTAAGGSDG